MPEVCLIYFGSQRTNENGEKKKNLSAFIIRLFFFFFSFREIQSLGIDNSRLFRFVICIAIRSVWQFQDSRRKTNSR